MALFLCSCKEVTGDVENLWIRLEKKYKRRKTG